MTTPDATPSPDVPLRMELTFELPGTPEQVWDAIATTNGISSWMMPTEVEEHEGGTIRLDMGLDMESVGKVTGWDPPRRFVYEEQWAAIAGQPEDAPVTPLVTEMLVEARSGGTCVLRVVTSSFGTGAAWEREFFTDMEANWKPSFDTLRLYLTHFPGQRVTAMSANADVAGAVEAVWSAVRQAVGAEGEGQPVEVRGATGTLERVSSPPTPAQLLIRLADPVPGFLAMYAWGKGEGTTSMGLQGFLFSDAAPAYVDREQLAWKDWLEHLAVSVS